MKRKIEKQDMEGTVDKKRRWKRKRRKEDEKGSRKQDLGREGNM